MQQESREHWETLSLSLNPRSQLHLLQSCMEKLVLGWMCYHSDKPCVVTTGLQSCRWPGKSLENLSSLLESQEKPGTLFAEKPLLSQRLSCIPTLPAACSHTPDPAQCLKRRHICERTGNQELFSKQDPQQSRNLTIYGEITHGILFFIPSIQGKGHCFHGSHSNT